MVSAKPRLISDFASGGGGVWGGILRLLHPFCFGEIRGGQKTENTNSILCLLHSTIFRPRSKGDHPRHSPRTFPLGLLAPRCLGLALLLAFARLRAGGSGAMLFGGRKESFPQLRSPPRSGLLEYSVLPFVLWSLNASWLRLACLRSPPSHNPLSRFQDCFRGVASATEFSIARLRRRSSFSHGRPSGNVRGSNTSCLPPACASTHTLYPPVRARTALPLAKY